MSQKPYAHIWAYAPNLIVIGPKKFQLQYIPQYRAFRGKANDTVLGGTVFGWPVLGVLQYLNKHGGIMEPRYSGDTVFGGRYCGFLPRINIYERDQLDKPKLRVLFNLLKCENTDFKAIYIHYTYNISEY